MAIVHVSITPIGTGSTSISPYVAACHTVLRAKEGLKWQLTPMGTIIEGELAEILAVIQEMHEVPFAHGARRVSTQIKIDDRRDKDATMQGKVEAVEEKL
ncbi:MAG: hypothetical protein DDT20_00970 [Firmicutes bacterium]|nr:hypothetical protein [Bacillota bacterium]